MPPFKEGPQIGIGRGELLAKPADCVAVGVHQLRRAKRSVPGHATPRARSTCTIRYNRQRGTDRLRKRQKCGRGVEILCSSLRISTTSGNLAFQKSWFEWAISKPLGSIKHNFGRHHVCGVELRHPLPVGLLPDSGAVNRFHVRAYLVSRSRCKPCAMALKRCAARGRSLKTGMPGRVAEGTRTPRDSEPQSDARKS